jgi:alanyl-tRNA synthetase
MTNLAAADLRGLFLGFFEAHQHRIVKSAPLIPQNDPTLMFTNAGMVQFKDCFVGLESRDYTKATSAQKCMRVSGKHNDLEEVGRTARHHTFFEMLGNFSFGDYFKDVAIELAWSFLSQELALDKDKIWITVFGGADGIPADTEARVLWRKISGLPDERIINLGMKDNFWAMGDLGPCGPCTEIHYDLRGKGAPQATIDDFESGRILEFWNNVFMQFERKDDGQLVSLPRPSVDTGMGLERLTAILQDKDSNYHSDLFEPLIVFIATEAQKTYTQTDSPDDISIRVIADHARATSFLVADGIQPSNEGRGYVMRRIMRRAIRHAQRLGFSDLFFYKACTFVADHMGDAYPELIETKTLIEKVASLEEENFRRTLDTGLTLLEQEIADLKALNAAQIPGTTVFKLYDTYGFPKDLTEVIADERELKVDHDGFATAMENQKRRSRKKAPGQKAVDEIYKSIRDQQGPTDFVGYTHESVLADKRDRTWRVEESEDRTSMQILTRVLSIIQMGQEVSSVSDGEAEIVLAPTPFYGESGGQIGDKGLIEAPQSNFLATVSDTQKPLSDLSVCSISVRRGHLSKGDEVWAGYDIGSRKGTRIHHSATHLLHGSLREVLGDHVKQAGSLVDAHHLRFDFSHFEPLTVLQICQIEDKANAEIDLQHEVMTDVLAFEAAQKRGAIAMFGEKYGDVVRVLTMGESVEFCGGTHVKNTTDIGNLLVMRDDSVASGVRRIEAQAGPALISTIRQYEQELVSIGRHLTDLTPIAEVLDSTLARSIDKAIGQFHELQALSSQRAETLPPSWPSDIGIEPLGSKPNLASIRFIRDLRMSLTRLTNSRSTELPAVAQRLWDDYPHLKQAPMLLAYIKLQKYNRENERAIRHEASASIDVQVDEILSRAQNLKDLKIITENVGALDRKTMRSLSDKLRDKTKHGVICIASTKDSNVTLIIAVTMSLTQKVSAGNLIKKLAPIIEGKGGGKADMAQGGGQRPDKLPELFKQLPILVDQCL